MPKTRKELAYHCQNWRGDVVSILKHISSTNCQVFETLRYSSYGVPFGIPPGDIEPDGDVDGDDNSNWPGSYAVRCDYDLDGDMDVTDQNLTIANSGRTLGRGTLSHSSVANRKGYCGYEHDGVIDPLAHVRHRVLLTELGRWSRRDPLGYVDGMGLFAYLSNQPPALSDALGLIPRERNLRAVCDADNGDGIQICHGNPGPPQPPPCQTPTNDVEIECSTRGLTNPEPSTSAVCDQYPPNYNYGTTNAGCFCRCAGDSEWSNFVRSCLACYYQQNICAHDAHVSCYEQAILHGFDTPVTTLAWCVAVCTGI